mgnify:CR=1 FL=1
MVAADNAVPLALWTRIFLKEQGYETKTTIYQDNTYAILSKKKGRKATTRGEGTWSSDFSSLKTALRRGT